MSDIASLALYLGVFATAALLIRYGIRRKSKIFRVLGVLLPILLTGLRLNVGTDYPNYVLMAERYASMSISDYNNLPEGVGVEIGFFALSKIVGYLGGDPWIFFVITSAFTISLAYIGIRRLAGASTPLAFFLFLLITLPFTMNVVRQGMAIAAIIFSLSYIINGNFIKYASTIFIASLFHLSALVMAPAYLIRPLIAKTRFDLNLTLLITISIALLITVSVPLLILLIASVPVFNGYLDYTGQGVGISLVMFGLKAAPIILMLLTYRKVASDYPKLTKILAVFMLIEVATYSLASLSGIFLRISYYFSIAALIYMALVPSMYSPRWRRRASVMIAAYGIVYFLLIYFFAGYSEIFPYDSIIAGGI